MYSLLHIHFESALRTIAWTKPDVLHRVHNTFHTSRYRGASPLQRLQMLEQAIRHFTQPDLFTKEIFENIVRGFLNELEQCHIEHADVRIGVSSKKWRWMNTIADGIEVFEQERQKHPQITLSFLGAVNFAKSASEIDEIFDVLTNKQCVSTLFVGIDINIVPENIQMFMQYVPSIIGLQQRGMKVNIHLGEVFDNIVSKEILAAIVPHRIGHGIHLLEDKSLVDFLLHHTICLDMCPISNTRLGVYDWNQPDNPAKKAMRLGIPVTINTDDPVLFQTTLFHEFELARLTAEERKIIELTGRMHRYVQR